MAGAHQWLESRLFEVLGGWVADTEPVQLRLMFDRHSRHGAWRAAQWGERLPVLADVDRAALGAPDDPAVDAVVRDLTGLTEPVARLAGVYRVLLPRAWAAYHSHRQRAGDPSDSSTIRTLDIVSSDLAGDWREGEVALQELLAGEADVVLAGQTVAALERRFV